MMIHRYLFANYLGKGTFGCLQLLSIPLLLRFLGIQAYGIIGLCSTFTALAFLFDGGIGAVVTSLMTEEETRTRNTRLKTLERMYLFIAAILGILLILAGSLFAGTFFLDHPYTPEEMQRYFVCIGVVVSLGFFVHFYQSAFIGLEKHIIFNIAQNLGFVCRMSLSLYLISQVQDPILGYFYGQIGGFIFLLTFYKWKYQKQFHNIGVFSFASLKKKQGLLTQMGLITIFSLFCMHLDKFFVGKFCTSKDFGIYSVCFSMISCFSYLYNPIYQTFYPRFSKLFGQKKQSEIPKQFQLATHILSIFVIPIVCVTFFFPSPILMFFFKDLTLIPSAQLTLKILIIGAMFQSFLYPSFALQHGMQKTKGLMYQYLGSSVVLCFLLWIVIPNFGIIGASFLYCAFNGIFLLLFQPSILYFIPKGLMSFACMRHAFMLLILIGSICWILGKVFSPPSILALAGISLLNMALGGLYFYVLVYNSKKNIPFSNSV